MQCISSTLVPQLCNTYQVRLFPSYAIHIKYDCSPVMQCISSTIVPRYAIHIKYACSPVMQCISSTIVPQLCNAYQVRLFPSYAIHIKYACSPLCNTYQVRLFPSVNMTEASMSPSSTQLLRSSNFQIFGPRPPTS